MSGPDPIRLPLPDPRWPSGVAGISTRMVAVEPGVRARLVEAGPLNGPPAVLLHGWACSAYSYRFLIPELADAGFRVVAPDLIGHGYSEKPSGESFYSTDALVRHGTALVRLAAGERRPLVVGHSMGGGVALRISLAQPGWFRALALFAPVGLGRVSVATLARWLSPPQVAPLLPALVRRWMFDLVLSLVRGGGSAYEARDLDEYWAPTEDPAFLPALRSILHASDWSPLSPESLSQLEPSTLVVLGAADRLISAMPASWPGWRALDARGARVLRVPRAGHVVHEERPELIRDAVLRLARETAGS